MKSQNMYDGGWPDSEGYAEQVPPPRNLKHRVTFGPGAFAAGYFVTVFVLSVGMVWGTTSGDYPFHLWASIGGTLYVFFIGSLIGLAAGVLPALLLGLLLRPVRSQWLHVLAFFAAGFAVPAALLLLFGNAGFAGWWITPLAIATATASGRASTWKLVRIND
jgi:hypothetical protein